MQWYRPSPSGDGEDATGGGGAWRCKKKIADQVVVQGEKEGNSTSWGGDDGGDLLESTLSPLLQGHSDAGGGGHSPPARPARSFCASASPVTPLCGDGGPALAGRCHRGPMVLSLSAAAAASSSVPGVASRPPLRARRKSIFLGRLPKVMSLCRSFAELNNETSCDDVPKGAGPPSPVLVHKRRKVRTYARAVARPSTLEDVGCASATTAPQGPMACHFLSEHPFFRVSDGRIGGWAGEDERDVPIKAMEVCSIQDWAPGSGSRSGIAV
uniref:Uncharacterized protein n=1 Tax=Hemiselmis andersenii TaxID=464988 RepID=A0A7S1GYU0_HEMAN|mmetsp:Transcript_24460/g.59334  ORF Transcript_24460/g.59334 Transcript_24460/m.59334 type:complete len:269 (+) Transcript_24460:64-870(+)